MLLDEIQEAYCKGEYHDKIGVELYISSETWEQLVAENQDLHFLSLDEDPQLPPMFGRPVIIDPELNGEWMWKYHTTTPTSHRTILA